MYVDTKFVGIYYNYTTDITVRRFTIANSPPTDTGSYTVIATYSGDDGNYGSTTSMKFNISK